MNGAAVDRIQADERAHEFGAPSAEQTPKSDDFAGLQRETDAVDDSAARETGDTQHFERLGRPAPSQSNLVVEAAKHVPDEFDLAQGSDLAAEHGAPVSQNGHLVADLEDLIDEVADVDDGDPFGLEAADDVEQPPSLARRER